MSAAFANETSPLCNVYFAAKIELEDGVAICEDIYDQNTSLPPRPQDGGKCLDVVDIALANSFTVSAGGCDRYTGTTTPSGGNWTVTLKEGCQLWNDPDDAVGIKTGLGNECLPTPTWDYDADTRTITFFRPDQAISHVEFIFCCSS